LGCYTFCLAIFPTKANPSRLKKTTPVFVDALKGLFLIFDEWLASLAHNFGLKEAWLLVSGCPYKLMCDYLAPFVLGSLIGKAKEICMAYAREQDVVIIVCASHKCC
jgi:hypothetical protein